MTPYTQRRTSSFCEQQITDEGLITICRGCHRLQSLCVSGCANITDAILHALGQNCPRLRWIYTPTHTSSLRTQLCNIKKSFHLVWKLILGSNCFTVSHYPPYPVKRFHLSAVYLAWFQECSLIDWQSRSWQTDVVPCFKRLFWNGWNLNLTGNKCYSLTHFWFLAKQDFKPHF